MYKYNNKVNTKGSSHPLGKDLERLIDIKLQHYSSISLGGNICGSFSILDMHITLLYAGLTNKLQFMLNRSSLNYHIQLFKYMLQVMS